jgi:hypothetical protein
LNPRASARGVLLVVVPENVRVVRIAIGVDEQDAAGDRIEIAIVDDRDPVLDLAPHHARKRQTPPFDRVAGYRY